MSRKKTAKKATRKKAAKKCGPVIRAEAFGSAVAIEFRRDGKTYRHQFGTGVKVCKLGGGGLVIAPVKIDRANWLRG